MAASRVRLGFSRVQVRDAPHREPRQMTAQDSRGLRDRDRQHSDRGRLIDHEQQRPVLNLTLDELA